MNGNWPPQHPERAYFSWGRHMYIRRAVARCKLNVLWWEKHFKVHWFACFFNFQFHPNCHSREQMKCSFEILLVAHGMLHIMRKVIILFLSLLDDVFVLRCECVQYLYRCGNCISIFYPQRTYKYWILCQDHMPIIKLWWIRHCRIRECEHVGERIAVDGWLGMFYRWVCGYVGC